MDGIIKKISCSKTMDVFKIEFTNSDMIFEFRNGKKNRADMVKKMKLQTGEHVIVIGAKSDASHLYVFGWDIKREGYISAGNCIFVKGTVEKLLNSGAKQMAYIKNGEKLMPVYINANRIAFHEGCNVAAICYASTYAVCQRTCPNWYTRKCGYCKRAVSEKRYMVMQLEQLKTEGEES